MVKLFVEGGGDHNPSLAADLRKGFSLFLSKAGFAGFMPRIIACGGRATAFHDFTVAVENGEDAMLLVDSEDLVSDGICPRTFLTNRDACLFPKDSNDNQYGLMVTCMESWFLADVESVETYYGKGFHAKELHTLEAKPEQVDRKKVYAALQKVAGTTKKGNYDKGRDSFKILATLDPKKVIAKSPWAKEFLNNLRVAVGQV